MKLKQKILKKYWYSLSYEKKKQFIQEYLLNQSDENIYNGKIDSINDYTELELDNFIEEVFKNV